jgi:hypothetical protein
MSCRACEEEMITFKYCSDCKEIIQYRCGSCKKEDEMSMHCHGRNKNQISLYFGQYVLTISNFVMLLNLV